MSDYRKLERTSPSRSDDLLAQRDQRILLLHSQGLTLSQIAERMGLHKDRIGQILKRLKSPAAKQQDM
jgi:DNA-binding NarL/FixJ family response regulator